MRAAVFERQGLDNLNVKEDTQQPTITEYDVLIKVRTAGVNPIDYFTVSNMAGIKPLPHIPGVEVTGIIEKAGNKVTTLNEDDKVVVYNVMFEGTCDMCLKGYEMLCRNAGIFDVYHGEYWEFPLILSAEEKRFHYPFDIGRVEGGR
jgi:D-arabinose 1-dehydrogenase-like Zn-dependent alcohol dehydrogenase